MAFAGIGLHLFFGGQGAFLSPSGTTHDLANVSAVYAERLRDVLLRLAIGDAPTNIGDIIKR